MAALTAWIQSYKPVFALLYLSLLGALCVSGVEVYLKMPVHPVLLFVCMGFIYGIYLLNRVADSDEDFINDRSRLIFSLRRSFHLAAAICSLGLSVAILSFQQKLDWIHLTLLSLGFLYSFHFIPWFTKYKGFIYLRIKEIFLVKNLSVAILWSGCVVLIPILYSGESLMAHPLLILMGIGLFISTFNNTLFDDICDIAGDTRANIKTLPTELGPKFCYVILFIINIIWISILLSLRFTGILALGPTVFLIALALYPFSYLILSIKNLTRRGWIDVLCEADLLVFAGGMFWLAH